MKNKDELFTNTNLGWEVILLSKINKFEHFKAWIKV